MRAMALAVLLVPFGSFVAEPAVAVFVTVPVAFEGRAKALLMVTLWPGVSVPRAQGKAVVQPPLFEAQVVPAGAGSLTVTLAASEGPLFVTVMVKFAVWPATAVPAVLAMERAAFGVTTVDCEALLLPGVRSAVGELAEAASDIVPPWAGAVATTVTVALPRLASVARLHVAVVAGVAQPGALLIVPLVSVALTVGVVLLSGPLFVTAIV